MPELNDAARTVLQVRLAELESSKNSLDRQIKDALEELVTVAGHLGRVREQIADLKQALDVD